MNYAEKSIGNFTRSDFCNHSFLNLTSLKYSAWQL